MSDAEGDAPIPRLDRAAMAEAIAAFLEAAGLPEAADGEAPARTAAAWAERLLSGYARQPLEVLENTWPDRTSDLVTLCAVPFVSVCEHHLLPFYGTAHLAYLPDGRLTGLSRLADLVDTLARRLQVQERLTEEIADALMSGLEPKGAACIVEASHDCVGARHLEYRDTSVQTVAWRGEFVDDDGIRDRFMRLALGGPGRQEGAGASPTSRGHDGASEDE